MCFSSAFAFCSDCAMRAVLTAMRASNTESTRVVERNRNVTSAIVPAIQELSTREPVRQIVSGAKLAAAIAV